MALPVLLVLLALIGAIIFLPSGSAFDIRGKAAPITVAPTRVALPTITATPIPRAPETVCTELYKPVCSQFNGITYANECEARLANAYPIKSGACPTVAPTKIITPAQLPMSQ